MGHNNIIANSQHSYITFSWYFRERTVFTWRRISRKCTLLALCTYLSLGIGRCAYISINTKSPRSLTPTKNATSLKKQPSNMLTTFTNIIKVETKNCRLCACLLCGVVRAFSFRLALSACHNSITLIHCEQLTNWCLFCWPGLIWYFL